MENVPFVSLNWFDNVENRPHPWPGYTWFTPFLIVPHVSGATELYQKMFGAVPIFQFQAPDGEIIFARMRYRGVNFVLNKEGFDFDGCSPAFTQPSVLLYVYVDDVKLVVSQALDAGCISVFEPRQELWGDLRARLKDPFGYVWDFAQKNIS